MAAEKKSAVVIPDSIALGSVNYAITKVKDLRDDDDTRLNGQIVWHDGEILLNEDDPLHEQLVALFHEWCEWVLRKTGDSNVFSNKQKEKLCDLFGHELAELVLTQQLRFP